MSIGNRGENLIFLISQPRAGSTMLQRMLAGHPVIFSTGEPWLMLPLIYMLHHKNDSAAVYRANWAQEALTEFVASLPAGTYETGVRRMVCTIYNEAMQGKTATHFLDKTPRYYHIIPQLADIFPEARFILLFRNPLAVLTSMIHTWIGESWFNMFEYKYDLQDAPRLLLEGQALLAERSLSVTYEDIIASPAQAITRICQHLKIDALPDLANYGDHAPHEKWSFGDPHNVYRRTRPDPQIAERWAQRLASPQTWRLARDYLDYLGPEMITSLGYDYDSLHQTVASARPHRVQRWLTFSLDALLSKTKYERTRPEFHLLNTVRATQKILSRQPSP